LKGNKIIIPAGPPSCYDAGRPDFFLERILSARVFLFIPFRAFGKSRGLGRQNEKRCAGRRSISRFTVFKFQKIIRIPEVFGEPGI
jgi:hypothetical protein